MTVDNIVFKEELQEVKADGSVQLLESEDKDGKKLRKIEGIAAKAGIINRNERMYPRHIFEKTLKEYVDHKVKAKKYIGELEHPDEVRSKLERAAAIFNEVWMDGDDLKFKATILPTPQGKILESLLEAGVSIGVSTRGYGSSKLTTMNGKDIEVIQDDFTMTGIDFVLDESNPHGSVNKFESIKGGTLDVEIKNVEQLKAHFPELTNELVESARQEGADAKEAELKESHEDAIAEAKVEAVKEYKVSEEGQKNEKAFNAMVEAIKPFLPETIQLEESELGKKVTSLTESTSQLESEKKDLEIKLQKAESKLAEIEGKEKIAKLVESKVKGHKFESHLRDRLLEAKSEEEVEAKFEKEVSFLESVFAVNENQDEPQGEGHVNEGQEDDQQEEKKAPLNEAHSKLARLAGLAKKK